MYVYQFLASIGSNLEANYAINQFIENTFPIAKGFDAGIKFISGNNKSIKLEFSFNSYMYFNVEKWTMHKVNVRPDLVSLLTIEISGGANTKEFKEYAIIILTNYLTTEIYDFPKYKGLTFDFSTLTWEKQ